VIFINPVLLCIIEPIFGVQMPRFLLLLTHLPIRRRKINSIIGAFYAFFPKEKTGLIGEALYLNVM